MSEIDRDALYAKAGEALHMGQVLELNVTVLIELLNRGHPTQIDAREIILDGDRKSLGQLIKELKKRASVPDQTAEMLFTALQARNYIAHEFFLRVTDAFSDKDAFAEAMNILSARAKEVMIGTAVTQGFVEGFLQHSGRDLADVRIRQDI